MKSFILSLLFLMLTAGCGNAGDKPAENQNNTNNNTEGIVSDTTKSDSMLVAVIKTNMGTIEVELFENEAPKTVENFKGLADKGYYNGIIFHRVIDNFMIQGGDPTGTGRGGESLWGSSFEDEFQSGKTFTGPGILAMANAGPNTNGSQFFITLVPTPWLNNRHTIFGQVIKGMDVVSAIGKTQTGPMDKPVKDVTMESVNIEKRDRK